jgi:diacylglycerol kinase (ATP)
MLTPTICGVLWPAVQMKQYRIILNPAAGRGRGAQSRGVIERTLGAAGASFELSQTRGPGEAASLAREAGLRGSDVIVAVGGDGTVHEVVNGMVQAAQANGQWAAGAPAGTLGVIPVGTGNDYGWRLGMPKNDPGAACCAVLSGRPRAVDLGQVTDEQGRTEIFHNHLGSGIEAAVAIESLKIRRLHGLWLYLTAGLRVIPRYTRTPQMTVHYNGMAETRPFLLASAANGGWGGGGFKIAPAARLDDGELDLVLADSPNVAMTLWLLLHLLAGTHMALTRYVKMHRTPRLMIEAPAGIPVHLDGEIFRTDARRIEVEVLPGRLQVITAADA